ncbi:unnamed protein product [Blepharisma stoltei]|uniref:Uncharacterized protein n=1 Tax=Blepharisma stoltei TaxID=1481888 RepID=A0AAU9J2R5_9CILI|nr:unnamed protein product [Blepharisma stoltei]
MSTSNGFEADLPMSTIESQPCLDSSSIPRISVSLRPGSSCDCIKPNKLDLTSESFRKSTSTASSEKPVEDMLFAKQAEYKAKLNSKILEKEWQEGFELRDKPKINPTSKTIAGKREVREKVIEKKNKEKTEYDRRQSFRAISSLVSLESIKKSLDSRISLIHEEPVPKKQYSKMSVTERNQYWLEEKQKKIENQRKETEEQELMGCTFHPELTPRIQFVSATDSTIDQKSSASGYSRNSSYKKKKASKSINSNKERPQVCESPVLKSAIPMRIPPPNPMFSLSSQPCKASSKGASTPILSPFYSQLTPCNKNYRFRSGCNLKPFLTKAKPMVDYTF